MHKEGQIFEFIIFHLIRLNPSNVFSLANFNPHIYNFRCSRKIQTALPWLSISNGLREATRSSPTNASQCSKSNASSALCTGVQQPSPSRPRPSRNQPGNRTERTVNAYHHHPTSIPSHLPSLRRVVLPRRDSPH